MSEDRGKLRISNADRDEAVALLKQALDEGRLELSEFDVRSQAVYEAKTNAELDLIFDDLPVTRAESGALELAAAEGAVETEQRRKRSVPGALHALVWVGSVTTAIWFVSNINSGDPEWGNFWPAYPMSILLAITIAQLITSRWGGDDDEC